MVGLDERPNVREKWILCVHTVSGVFEYVGDAAPGFGLRYTLFDGWCRWVHVLCADGTPEYDIAW